MTTKNTIHHLHMPLITGGIDFRLNIVLSMSRPGYWSGHWRKPGWGESAPMRLMREIFADLPGKEMQGKGGN